MVDAYCHCCVFNKLTNICSQFLFFCDGLILAPLCTKPNWLLNCPQKAALKSLNWQILHQRTKGNCKPESTVALKKKC